MVLRGKCIFVLVVVALATAAAQAQPVLPLRHRLGVNIHFTDARPGEMQMLADSGVGIVRMDLTWSATEPQRGVYDFAAYDRLLGELDRHGLGAMLILNYRHPLYDDGLSPHTDQGRAAFARWAAAAVSHFRGRGVVWELYNEPNILPFWTPRPNPEDYIRLAAAVGDAIDTAAPQEMLVGPASSTIDRPFLEACFRGGLLRYFDAVTVHPYRRTPPETAQEEYRDLRLLIAKYAPAGRSIPIISGEWGYSTAWEGVNDDLQARLLARQWLTNLANDVPLSIWYDWHDDGANPADAECNFGIVEHEYRDGQEQVYAPKLAYRAAQALAAQVGGLALNKRLSLENPDDHVLLFGDSPDLLAVWTSGGEHEAIVPASAGEFAVTDHLGQELPRLTSSDDGLTVRLSGSPLYLRPLGSNRMLNLAARWERLPAESIVRWQDEARVALRMCEGGEGEQGEEGAEGERSFVPDVAQPRQRIRINWPEQGLAEVYQETTLVLANPLSFTLAPRDGDAIPVILSSTSDQPLQVELRLVVPGAAPPARAPAWTAVGLLPASAERVFMLLCDLPDGAYTAGLSVRLDGQRETTLPPRTFQPIRLAQDLWNVQPDGDPTVGSEQSLSCPKLVAAHGLALHVDYRFDAGWKFLAIRPSPAAAGEAADLVSVPAGATHLGMWIKGDQSGNWIRMRYVDSAGQVFQPTAGALDFDGWRYITLALHGPGVGNWGGPADGIPRPPFRLDTLLLIDSAHRQATQGGIGLAAPTWVGGVEP